MIDTLFVWQGQLTPVCGPHLKKQACDEKLRRIIDLHKAFTATKAISVIEWLFHEEVPSKEEVERDARHATHDDNAWARQYQDA